MHIREQLILNCGPRTLGGVYCETCKEKTLHVRSICDHCISRPNSSGSADRVSNRGRMSKVENRWPAEHDAARKVRMSVAHNEDQECSA
jgi:hypothetical protein